MSGQAQKIRELVETTRYRLKTGQISYDEARALLAPTIQHMNARGREIAQEYGVKFRAVSFTSLMR